MFGGDQGLSVSFTAPACSRRGLPAYPLAGLGQLRGTALIILVLLANLARSRIGRAGGPSGTTRWPPRWPASTWPGCGSSPSWSARPARAWAAPARHLLLTVSPGAFTLTLSIALLTAAVIGGLGSLAGALWGSLVIVLVPTYVTDVATSHGLSSAVAANIPVAAYGVVLIAVMLVFPAGIQGGLRRFFGLTPPADAGPLARLNSLRRRPPASEHQEEGTT